MFLSISSIFSSIGSIGIAVIALLIMVTVHEFGHYIAGKVLGFKINEFAIGFGPKLFSRKKEDGEVFSIRAFPLGGFCAFEGEDKEIETEGAFNKQKPWKRIIVTVAGVAFNFATAIIIFTMIFAVHGYMYPRVNDTTNFNNTQLEHTLQKGDIILKVNGKQSINLYQNNVGDLIQNDKNTAELVILRNGKKQTIVAPTEKVTVQDAKGNSQTLKRMNITVDFAAVRFNIFKSFWYGIKACGEIIILIITTLGKLITGALAVKGSVGGPITTISTVATSVTNALSFFYILAVMSASIAFTNILPIPALDGSRIIFITIEKLRGKPINRKIEGTIHVVGLFILLGLTLLLDLLNFIG